MQMKGIDVSHWQGDIDFEQVKKSGMDFVIIKAGEWNHTDSNFEKYYEDAKAAGLHIGFYWYCDGETLDQISMEADACIQALEGKQFDFPIYIDLENAFQYNLGKQFCSDAVRTFCDKLEKAGYFTGLYTSTSWLNSVIDDDVKKRYTLWVADWRGYCGYDGEYGMWQYGAGHVPGINGVTDLNIVDFGIDTDYPGSVVEGGVDLDYSYVDYPSVIAANGYNNYPKSDPEAAWENDECKDIANTLSISGTETALSNDRWMLIDKSCNFTLETLPYARVRIWLVGGGQDGAEWIRADDKNNGQEAFIIGKMSRGGCVYQKEIYITGNVQCQAIIAERNDFYGTSLRIGTDVYKCTDDGYVHRRATASSNGWQERGGYFNAESGANGIPTPYGYVGSSGGGGGAYSELNYKRITVYAGKGGVGAGDGGEVYKDGQDAINYGCGGGAAGFCGFPSDGLVVETHAGKGRGGCVIFEILDSGECDDSPNNPNRSDGSGGSGCCCTKLENIFTCPEKSSTTTCEEESSYKLTYDNADPVETETFAEVPCTTTSIPNDSSNTVVNSSGNSGGSCGCGGNKSSSGCSNNCSHTTCNCSNGGGKGCVSYDVSRWGENWLLFDESGEYTLDFETDVKITAYIVGGGSDGGDGMYYNKTAYGGVGGMGGFVNIVSDIEVSSGTNYIQVNIGGRGGYAATSFVIDNQEYCCSDSGWTVAERGIQAINGKSLFRNGGNGTNGVETPFGWVGSSGGSGAAYYNGKATGYGRGGMSAGDGGKIVDGKSTKGGNATGYGCGGGGGAASSTSWCKGGKGKRGCVILRIQAI